MAELNWYFTIFISLFFGPLGVDRFMMGHVGMGIFKLLTFGGLGLLQMVDFLGILFRSTFGDTVKWKY